MISLFPAIFLTSLISWGLHIKPSSLFSIAKFVRNPKTNEKIFKEETKKIHFKISKILHKKINNLD